MNRDPPPNRGGHGNPRVKRDSDPYREIPMEKDSQLGRILEFAIEKEESARRFYMDLAKRVSDASTQETLRYLAEEEAKHREFLEKYLRGEAPEGALRTSEVVDYKILEYLEEEPSTSDNLSMQDAYLLAAKREKVSYEFYHSLSRLHPEGSVRDLLARMANEELRHKEKVEYLYTNAAFPQTAGG